MSSSQVKQTQNAHDCPAFGYTHVGDMLRKGRAESSDKNQACGVNIRASVDTCRNARIVLEEAQNVSVGIDQTKETKVKSCRRNRRAQVVDGLINSPYSLNHLSSVPSFTNKGEESVVSLGRRTQGMRCCGMAIGFRNVVKRKFAGKRQSAATSSDPLTQDNQDQGNSCGSRSCSPRYPFDNAWQRPSDDEANDALRRSHHDALGKAYSEIASLHQQVEDLQRTLNDEQAVSRKQFELVTASWKGTADHARSEITELQKQISILQQLQSLEPMFKRLTPEIRERSPITLRSSRVPKPGKRLKAIARIRSPEPPITLLPVEEDYALEEVQESEVERDCLVLQLPDLTHSRSSSVTITPSNTPPPASFFDDESPNSDSQFEDDVSPLWFHTAPSNSPVSPTPLRKGSVVSIELIEQNAESLGVMQI